MSNEQQHSTGAVNFDRSALLAFLATMQRDFDHVLLKARNQFPGPDSWVGALLLRSLIGFKYVKVPDDNIQKFTRFFSNHITVWGAIVVALAGISLNEFVESLAWAQPRTIGIGLFVLSFLFSVKANFTRMLTLDDPYFTPVAYKLFRPKEYYMIIDYLKGDTFTFSTVHDWVKLLYNENSLDAITKEYERNTEALRKEIAELRSSLQESNMNIKNAESEIDVLNETIKKLMAQINANEDGFKSAIDILYRLRKRTPMLFGLNDLRLISNFSLFEVIGDDLYMIAEQGTTETPYHIDIHNQDFAHYSSVKLISSDSPVEYATSDREGRTVASYWIELPSERVVIYNFHYDSTNSNIRDIIESKEMYRFIEVICMLLDERGLLVIKEGVRDEKA